MSAPGKGFTLIEVMVGAVIALIVIGIVTSTFLSQQRSMQAMDLSREASNGGRDAMLSMQETIGRAGYGVDPRFAFDFRNYSCPAWSAGSPCRDSISGPDELVFIMRDPGYYWAGTPASVIQGCDPTAPCSGHAWQLLGFDATHVTVSARANDTFLQGQVLQFACAKGSSPTMGRVGTTAKAVAAGALQITLDTAAAGDPYRANLGAGHDACFDGTGAAPGGNASPGASVFLIHRYRYHVASLNGEPWLLLDRGLDYNQNGTTAERVASGSPDVADEIPIARGVEDLQIAYVMKPSTTGIAAPDNGADWVIGDSEGTLEEADPTATAPLQSSSDVDPSRFTLHPANIRAVRIRLTVRSIRQDVAQPAPWPGDPAVPAGSTGIENRNDFTAVNRGRYRRYFSAVVVSTPNLGSKDPFIF
ncbi:MAG: prepilin-type N-terminal cleavage/methylation domain-containing protein [Myxococcales bacterium]